MVVSVVLFFELSRPEGSRRTIAGPRPLVAPWFGPPALGDRQATSTPAGSSPMESPRWRGLAATFSTGALFVRAYVHKRSIAEGSRS